jgi:hypothetical protein
MRNTHYGDEDPELKDDTDPEFELELFQTARFLGWKPDEMKDREFAARFAKWLEAASSEL